MGTRRVRPDHLRTRQVKGAAFGEDADRIRKTGSRNEYDEWIEGAEATLRIDCSVAPVPTHDLARRRLLEDEGIRLEAARILYTDTEIVPQTDDNAGDIIVYSTQRWRVREVQGWETDFFEALIVRIESQ